MEFVIKKSDLVHELQTVTGVVEKRATIPILANLLLETRNDGLQVGASDIEVTIRGMADAKVVKEGSVTLPAAKLHEIARSLPEADVTFKLLDRHQVAISCNRTKYRISGQARDEFPPFPEVDLDQSIALPAGDLRQMIERVAFAITTEDPRYSLNGALVIIEQGKITLVATDGHRLSYISKPVELEVKDGPIKVIVPRKALNEVAKLTAELDDSAQVMFGKNENQVFFAVGRHKLTSSLLEGNFPRYENVMPKSCETEIVLPVDDLSKAVRRVSLLASDRYGRSVRLSLSSGKLGLTSTTEMGDAEETLAVDYDGPDLTVGFNARYLIEYFGAVGSPSVMLGLNPGASGEDGKAEAGDKPGRFTPEPAGDVDYRYIVMPMHL
ncbi:MAG: DNA polymerase III subunit beta [Acidobacteriota bacterium]|nr:DNA polymerase III subunit beta [Acidobacteriota bacterium]MDH3783886.1 DNA polymerase III subunit beta [Acidobacteriota bacterium]